MGKVRTLVIAAAMVATMAGCAVKPVSNWQAISGSKADATVKVGCLYGIDEKAVVTPQLKEQALKRCEQWGYKDAEPFGFSQTECNRFVRSPFGGLDCHQWIEVQEFQCIDKHVDSYLAKPGDPDFVGPVKPLN